MIHHVVCSGKAYALGEEYGLQCQELVRNFSQEIEEVFAVTLGLDPKLLTSRAVEYFKPSILKFAPHLWEEIQGLSDATGLSTEKLLFLQSFSEFLYGMFPDGVIASISGESSIDRSSIIALNIDFIDAVAERYLVLREINDDHGRRILMFGLAGTLGLAGMNSQGLVALSTGLEASGVQKGLPSSMQVRLALEQATLSGMVQAVTDFPRPTARNYLLASRDTCIDLETTISEATLLWPPPDGVLVHTNHYLSDGLKELDLGLVRWPESSDRLQRCMNILQEESPLSEMDLAITMSDHVHHPKGICRHQTSSGKKTKTIASLIAIPSQGKLQICPGNPCTGSFSSFTFSDQE